MVCYSFFALNLLLSSFAYAQDTILILGDSLSAGYKMNLDESWVTLMDLKLQQCSSSVQVINLSTSGDTTRDGLQKIDKALEKYSPNLVVIELGGNDGLRGLPLFSIKKNLNRMIETSKKAKAKVLLLGIQLPPNYGAGYTEKFKAIYPDLAQVHGVLFAPFILENIALNEELMHRDGVHPTVQAQPMITELLFPHFLEALEYTEQQCSAS